MTKTTVEQVKQCHTPQEALLVLAAAIDALTTVPPPDPWDGPLDWDSTTDTVYSEVQPDNRARLENGDVIVERASAEREVARAEFVAATQLYEFGAPLSPADFTEAYIKGGPRWLYYTNRDAVMQMPLALRTALVADVELDSPSEAGEISRDILKFDESVPEGTQVEAHRREYGPLG